MKAMISKILNETVGKLLRLLQGMLMNDQKLSLVSLVHNLNVKSSAEYAVENMSRAMVLQNRPALYDYCIEKIKETTSNLNNHGNQYQETILEFGVYKGSSINYFAKRLPNVNFVGFDSFEGLEENWTGTFLGRNALTVHGVLPKVMKNVELRKGWFVDTLPAYLGEPREKQVFFRLLNIDCDTYKPTKFILEQLESHIQPGLIIIFDEYFNYINWREHEYAAFSEFTKSRNIKYKYIAFSDTTAVAVEII
jgi:hypothetical protein